MTKVFFFQAEDGIRDGHVTGVQTCALPISHPEMGYRSCLGIIRLAEEYSSTRMEAAADRALRTGACRYQSVKSILKNSLRSEERRVGKGSRYYRTRQTGSITAYRWTNLYCS